jgi:hypothetical protein
MESQSIIRHSTDSTTLLTGQFVASLLPYTHTRIIAFEFKRELRRARFLGC